MPIDNLTEFIEKIEKAGELHRVKTQVDADLEIAEILRRVMYANGRSEERRVGKECRL